MRSRLASWPLRATNFEYNQTVPTATPADAQQKADRIRILRDELAAPELRDVLGLSPDQLVRFDEWSRARLVELERQFDVDTTSSQKRVSWGMRIAATLGGLALCAALVLFFLRFWGYLETWQQMALLIAIPLVLLAATEFAARRERARYFTGLLGLTALTAFIMNLSALGTIFNLVPTERALLPWGIFALLLAYRYGLRLHLAAGLALLTAWVAATCTTLQGVAWGQFASRPEIFLLLGFIAFACPFAVRHAANREFDPVYRLVGALVALTAVLSLAAWGASSYLPWETDTIEHTYEFVGLALSTGAIWWGITRSWTGTVNTGAVYFTIFLFIRLYHWWWQWMPKYLFFAAIGAIAIGLVIVFKQLRTRLALPQERAA